MNKNDLIWIAGFLFVLAIMFEPFIQDDIELIMMRLGVVIYFIAVIWKDKNEGVEIEPKVEPTRL